MDFSPSQSSKESSKMSKSTENESKDNKNELNNIYDDFNEIRKKYHNLMGVLSNHIEEEQSDYISSNENLTFATDEKLEFEIQQWNSMWHHLVSMIGQVVPVSNIRFKTGSDKRAILVDLVSKLCDLAITPKQTKEYMRLKEKYQNCKLEIKELQEKNQQISQEIDALPKENTNDPELERKVQKLSQLIKRQIHTQTKLIQNNEFEAKALKPIPTHSLSDDSGSSETFTKHKTKNHSIPKNKSMNHKLAKSNLSSDGSYFEGDFSESSMLSFHRKYEIDDSIAEKENTYGSIRKSYGNHVNQLINLTNKLQKDYNKLNIPKYSTSDLSIEELSRLNDSLLSSESKFGEYTE